MQIKGHLAISWMLPMFVAGTVFAQSKPQKSDAPIAGSASRVAGVTVEEIVVVARGWSVKKFILDKAIKNDTGEKLGKVEDIIIAPDKVASYAIVGVGGFLGLGRHEVAIPIKQLTLEKDHFVLPGATKDVVKAMPRFEYAQAH